MMGPDDIGRIAGMVKELEDMVKRHPDWSEVNAALDHLKGRLEQYLIVSGKLPGASR
jgi:hypothetical protein